MKFTYQEYEALLHCLKDKGYKISDYKDEIDNLESKEVILRHDVDMDLGKAAVFAELEAENQVKATYFVLVTSNLYNIFDKESRNCLKQIMDSGHSVGLHFDETQYIYSDCDIREYVNYEKQILESVIGREVKTVSMHMPSKHTLQKNYRFETLINSYGKDYFRGVYKYLSDSNMFWREKVFEVIESEQYSKLHILTHPIWYDDVEQDKTSKVKTYLDRKSLSIKEEIKILIPDFEIK